MIAFKVFQEISEIASDTSEPSHWIFYGIVLPVAFLSNTVYTFITDFALRCTDILETNAQIPKNWTLMLNFVKFKQMIFMRHSSSYWPIVGAGDMEKV